MALETMALESYRKLESLFPQQYSGDSFAFFTRLSQNSSKMMFVNIYEYIISYQQTELHIKRGALHCVQVCREWCEVVYCHNFQRIQVRIKRFSVFVCFIYLIENKHTHHSLLSPSFCLVY